MRFRFGLVSMLIGTLFAALVGFAPAASAASGCNDPQMNWRLHELVRSGHYVIKSFYSSSHTVSCLVVKRDDGKRINVQLNIERDYTKKGKATTNAAAQYLGVKRIARTFSTDNVWITVQVYANVESRQTLPYRGTTTLLRS